MQAQKSCLVPDLSQFSNNLSADIVTIKILSLIV
jgi:hypothetical protein